MPSFPPAPRPALAPETRRACRGAALIVMAAVAAAILTAPVFAAVNPSAGVSWRSIGPGEFGAMFGAAISPHDPKVIVAGLDMGNAFITHDSGKSWKILGRNGGVPFANPAYRGVWGVCFDPVRPDRMFIGSEHGLFRSADGGASWRLVHGGTADYTTRAIAIDPANPDVVYAACGVSARGGDSWSRGEVLRSTDGGDAWSTLGGGGPLGAAAVKGANWVTLAIDPQSRLTARHCHRRVYLAGQSGFFVSEDGGDTWTSLEQRLPGGILHVFEPGVECRSISDLALSPGRGRSTLFAAIVLRPVQGPGRGWLGGVYRSDDGGQTWVEKNKGLEASLADCARGDLRYCLISSCPAAPGVLYLNNAEGVYKTTNRGDSWRSIVNTGTVWLKRKDFDGTPTDWRVRDRSGNFDQSYYNVYGPANGLAVSPTDPNAVAYTDNAGMGLSYDGGVHWTEPGFEFGKAVWPGEFGDRPPMQATNLVRSRGFQLINPLAAAIDPFDPKTLAIGYADTGLEISRDGGAWWEWAYHGILSGERNYIRAILFDPAVPHRLFVGGGGWGGHGHVNRSDDSGRTFRRIGIPQLDAEAARIGKTPYVNALALDPNSPADARTLYAATDLGLFKSVNGGAAWTLVPVLAAGAPIKTVTVDPVNPQRLYAAPPGDAPAAQAGLYRSEDGGATWAHTAPAVLGGIQSLSVCAKTGTLYAVAFPPGQPGGFWAARSLWRSDDHGQTWRKLDDRLASVVAVSPIDPDRVYQTVFAEDVTRQETNVFRSVDGGKTWQAIADDIPLSPGGDGNRIVFDPANPSRLIVTHDSGVYLGVEQPEQDTAVLRGGSAPPHTLWLDSLDLSTAQQGYGAPAARASVDGHPLTLGGVVYPHGFGTHSVGRLSIRLHGAATHFSSMVGIDDETRGKGSVIFSVIVDGKEAATTGVLHGGDPPRLLSVDLAGAQTMVLRVGDAGDGFEFDHADWAGALFTLAPSAAQRPETYRAGESPARMVYQPEDPHPAIHGARIVGAGPGHPFLFLVPATGKEPLTYEAQNLPTGLTLDARTGVISGVLQQSGETTVRLTVRGPRGTAKRTLTIVAGAHKLALTPPMGWNSWNVWGTTVDAGKVRAAADEMVATGLARHGFQYINIDEGWDQEHRDANGRLQPQPSFHDMRDMTAYVHSKGLRVGIYSSPGPLTCDGPFSGSWQHEEQDARTFADWRFDYLKYDWCSYSGVATGTGVEYYRKPYAVMRAALDKVDRDIVFSFCQYGMGDVWKWAAQTGGNTWRTHGDIDDNWNSLHDIYEHEAGHEQYAGPGHWNDPDMLMVGVVGKGNTHPTHLTPNEQILHISLWCLLSSPLLIGCDMTRMDPFTLALLSNDEALDINQDSLGRPASRVIRQGDAEVWARPLFDGTRAVGLVNGGDEPAAIAVPWSVLGIKGRQPVRDLWLHKNVGSLNGSYSAEVPAHGCVLLKIGRARRIDQASLARR